MIMKKKVFKVVLITSAIFISFNKADAQKGLQLGFEANPQVSYLLNKADMDSELYTGKTAINGHFGVSGQYGITEKVGIGLNVLYSFQGDKYEWKGEERVKSLQYLKIPLMLTLNLPMGDKMIFVGKIGPQLSILSDARLYDGDRKIESSHYKGAFVSTDFGGMISAGIGYKLNDHFTLDGAVRGDVGFVDAEDNDFTKNIHNPSDLITPSPASSPRSATYNMTVGLTFGVRYTFL
jgi:hypothetical protein